MRAYRCAQNKHIHPPHIYKHKYIYIYTHIFSCPPLPAPEQLEMLNFLIPALSPSPLLPCCRGLAMAGCCSLSPWAAPDAAWEEVGEKRWSFFPPLGGQWTIRQILPRRPEEKPENTKEQLRLLGRIWDQNLPLGWAFGMALLGWLWRVEQVTPSLCSSPWARNTCLACRAERKDFSFNIYWKKGWEGRFVFFFFSFLF